MRAYERDVNRDQCRKDETDVSVGEQSPQISYNLMVHER